MTDHHQDELFAHAPGDVEGARSEYQAVRAALGQEIIGRSAIVERLALVALAHRRRLAPVRLLLSGPTGTGKSHMAMALSRATGSTAAPFEIDCSTLVEAGWAGGTTIPDYLSAWAAREGGVDKIAGGVDRVAGGVLVLDEIDKLAVAAGATGNTVAHAQGRMAAVLSVLGTGTPLRLGPAANQQLDPADLLVIACGAFSSAEWSLHRAPTTEELTAYGLTRELADRLAVRLHVPMPDEAELVCRFRDGTGAAARAYIQMAKELGYSLTIADATYVYAARWVLRGGAGVREASATVGEAAATALTRALRDGLPPGTTLTITPDDLEGIRSAAPRRR